MSLLALDCCILSASQTCLSHSVLGKAHVIFRDTLVSSLPISFSVHLKEAAELDTVNAVL